MRPFLIALFLLASLLAWRVRARFYSPHLKITFFDVGQGDSALIEFPGNERILIDAGGGIGEWNLGKLVLFRELTRLGILTLDAALITHPDQDHAYGFLGLAEKLRTKEVWFNSDFARETRIRNLLETGWGQGRAFWRPSKIEFGGANLTLWPLHLPGPLAESKTNNRCLVTLLSYGGCRVLFTGDIEKPAEDLLLRFLETPAEVLKVAHHGSKTSSTEALLKKLTPKIAVVSVGEKNHYGHPVRGILKRLKLHGTEIFRTDFHGYVELSISPDGWIDCTTFLGSCGRLRCGKG